MKPNLCLRPRAVWLWFVFAGVAVALVCSKDRVINYCEHAILAVKDQIAVGDVCQPTTEVGDSTRLRIRNAYIERFAVDARQRFEVFVADSEEVAKESFQGRPWIGKYEYNPLPSMCSDVWLYLFPDGRFVYSWEADYGYADLNYGSYRISSRGITLRPRFETAIGWELSNGPELSRRYSFRTVGTNSFLVPMQLKSMTDREAGIAAMDRKRTNTPPYVVFRKVH